jgi:hypothetical protein
VSTTLQPLDQLHTADEVAQSVRRSTRWLKDYMKNVAVDHTAISNRIYFTTAQRDAFVESFRVTPVAESITTGTSKS